MSGILGGEGLAMLEHETITFPRNGHQTGESPIIRRMPVKTRRVDLDGDFVGWWAKVRTNAPFGLFLKLTNMGGNFGEDSTKAANAMGELLALLPQLVSEWNFVDTEGEPLPCDATGMQQLPMELINALFGAISAGEPVPKV